MMRICARAVFVALLTPTYTPADETASARVIPLQAVSPSVGRLPEEAYVGPTARLVELRQSTLPDLEQLRTEGNDAKFEELASMFLTDVAAAYRQLLNNEATVVAAVKRDAAIASAKASRLAGEASLASQDASNAASREREIDARRRALALAYASGDAPDDVERELRYLARLAQIAANDRQILEATANEKTREKDTWVAFRSVLERRGAELKGQYALVAGNLALVVNLAGYRQSKLSSANAITTSRQYTASLENLIDRLSNSGIPGEMYDVLADQDDHEAVGRDSSTYRAAKEPTW